VNGPHGKRQRKRGKEEKGTPWKKQQEFMKPEKG